MIVDGAVSAVSTIFSGVISGAGGLTKRGGASTLTLSGTNTYRGVTTVDDGTLRVENSDALGAVAGHTIINARIMLAYSRLASLSIVVNIAEPIMLNGGTLLSRGLGSFTASGTIMLVSDNNSRISVAGVNNMLTLSGDISGAGGFTKSGSGTLTLSGTGNNYSGVTSYQ